jgi:hypothetical protein
VLIFTWIPLQVMSSSLSAFGIFFLKITTMYQLMYLSVLILLKHPGYKGYYFPINSGCSLPWLFKKSIFMLVFLSPLFQTYSFWCVYWYCPPFLLRFPHFSLFSFFPSLLLSWYTLYWFIFKFANCFFFQFKSTVKPLGEF